MSAAGRSLAADTGHVRHADDFYATPAWCTEAILQHLGSGSWLDPCCGEGAILDVARRHSAFPAYGLELDAVRAQAARAKGHVVATRDALDPNPWPSTEGIITNPPYKYALEFVLRALLQCQGDCAFLLRLNWLASQKRADFHRKHPSDIFVLPRRPSFTGGGTDATEYAWFVWGPNRGNRWQILNCK